MTKSRFLIAATLFAAMMLLVTSSALAQAGIPAPGLYVTDLKFNPDPVQMGSQVTFTPTFQNTTNGPVTFKWRVLIYEADTTNKSYGDTTWLTTEFPGGTSNQLSLGDWHASPDIVCNWYFVHVVWQDQDNNSVPFSTPDGKVFEKGFNTCNTPSTSTALVPTVVPTTAPVVTTASAPVRPGLYVSDLKFNPSPVQMGSQVTFTPTFQNTTGNPLTFKWRVLIYEADTTNKSYGDTTWTTTEFPGGPSDQLSLGDWHASPDIACNWYFVRVVLQDQDNNSIPFTTPDGNVFEKGFNTCP